MTPALNQAIGQSYDYYVHPGVVLTGDAYHQELHLDDRAVLSNPQKGFPYVLHCPLDQEGLGLRVLRRDTTAKNKHTYHEEYLYAPLGEAFLVRADVFHSGHYGKANNIRLHAYIQPSGRAAETKSLFFFKEYCKKFRRKVTLRRGEHEKMLAVNPDRVMYRSKNDKWKVVTKATRLANRRYLEKIAMHYSGNGDILEDIFPKWRGEKRKDLQTKAKDTKAIASSEKKGTLSSVLAGFAEPVPGKLGDVLAGFAEPVPGKLGDVLADFAEPDPRKLGSVLAHFAGDTVGGGDGVL